MEMLFIFCSRIVFFYQHKLPFCLFIVNIIFPLTEVFLISLLTVILGTKNHWKGFIEKWTLRI